MRKHNNFYIIGVDAGYGNMKTARTIYPTGLVAMVPQTQVLYARSDLPHGPGGDGHQALF